MTSTPSSVDSQGLCPVQDGLVRDGPVRDGSVPDSLTQDIPAPPSSAHILTNPTGPCGQEHTGSHKSPCPSGSGASAQTDPDCSSDGTVPSVKLSSNPKSCETQKTPPKRRFASVAKKVIMQERLRRAEEDLGQHYLLLADEKDTEKNNHLAVSWFIKAAKQGRKGAAKILRRCWIQKRGITSENEADVRKLSTESKFELAVRKAAMMMYWKLNPDRKSKVAVAEMLENVSQVNTAPGLYVLYQISIVYSTLALILFYFSKQMVDLDDFVEMTKNYAQGIVQSTPANDDTKDTGKSKSSERLSSRYQTWENFKTLTSLLTRFEPGLDVEQAETNFGWNNLEQYIYFIISVFFVIFTFPVADKGWIPCSELSTVAIFFTVISYHSLSPAAAMYARKAMLIEVASFLCGLTHFLPEKMTALRLLGHTFATVPLGESVVLKLSLPCLLYAYLFFLIFRMAMLRGFRGTYCFLVPYLVCFMWCEFSVVLLQHSSAVGLIRTCVAYFLFLFALPVLAFGLATMLFIQLFKWFLELELTKVIVTLIVCAIPVTLRLWTRFSTSILDVARSLTHRGPVKLILLCISMVLLFFAVYLYYAEGQKVYNSTLTWHQYSEACGPPSWKSKGMAQTQIFCSHLYGHRVTWTGRFKHVRVAETENGAHSVINMLPVFMGDWLRCLYGETYPKCEPKNATEEEELCEIKALAKHTCHVKRFDSYRFEVTVGIIYEGRPEMEDPARDILLMASHEFRQVLFNLEPGNLVEFSTKLEGRLGAKAPAFELKAIHCLDCTSSLLTGGRQVKIERNWRRTTLRALKFAFDFFFSPILSAKIST
uniref:Uncharacterized protein n=1 Tax=Periophthalmus magnuspinnatus TaxID=409849 RepID=A0A3B4BNI4_9GOBI